MRRVGRPRGRQQGAGEGASLDLGQQLTDLLDQRKREDVPDGDGEETREEVGRWGLEGKSATEEMWE